MEDPEAASTAPPGSARVAARGAPPPTPAEEGVAGARRAQNGTSVPTPGDADAPRRYGAGDPARAGAAP